MKRNFLLFALLLTCGDIYFLDASELLLEEQVEHDLEMIYYPRRTWVVPKVTNDGLPILNVAIIGGGQTGLTTAFALQRENIDQVMIYDENPEDRSGSWIRIGRMSHLRTPKYTTGPDLGIPVLTIQSWYEATYGREAWEMLDYIPRLTWHTYLNWYRRVLHLPVQFESRVGPLSWDKENECFSFLVTTPQRQDVVYARKVVLATGLEGSGEWMIPECVKKNVSADHYAQAVTDISPDQIRGKEIAILGAGPNAFDLTLECAKQGAKSITLFSKRDRLVNLHCFKWGEYTGFLKAFWALSDEDKYQFVARFHEMGQPPVPDRVAAAMALDNFSIQFNSPLLDAFEKENRVHLKTAKGTFSFDFLILATGWVADLQVRPEIKEFEPFVATWADKFVPKDHPTYQKLMKFPYLGSGFQFMEKEPGTAPYLHSLFNMTGGGLLSNGFCAGTGLTGMKYSIDLITQEIVKQFFLEEREAFYRSLDHYDREDFPLISETNYGDGTARRPLLSVSD